MIAEPNEKAASASNANGLDNQPTVSNYRPASGLGQANDGALISNPIDDFLNAIAQAGLVPPLEIVSDGLIHRFSSNGKTKDEAGWYVFYADQIAAGAFGCWRLGTTVNWCSKSTEVMTHTERAVFEQKRQAMAESRRIDGEKRKAEACDAAARVIARATPATGHGYLTAKGIQPHGALIDGELLILPMRDTNGVLHSLQRIAESGDKRFLSGGRVTGCFYQIGALTDSLIVCEGFATGASIREATGASVAVAFNASNLQPVAMAFRAKYPGLKIVIASDDDSKTEGNPGLTKATEAAQAVNGRLATPIFLDAGSGSDFNDLHRIAGAGAVKECIERALNDSKPWPNPAPLPTALPPVEAFHDALLPESLRAWVLDIANRMQCPVDYVGVGAIVTLSGLIGARAVVRPKALDEWEVVPNLWGAVIGSPGVMKSPALKEVLKPLQKLQTSEAALVADGRVEHHIDVKLAEMGAEEAIKKARKTLAKGAAGKQEARALLLGVEKPLEPTSRNYIINDATVEKLGVLFSQNPWGLFLFRDEMYGLFSSLDKAGQEGSRGFYLSCYDGNQPYVSHRIGRGTTESPRLCLSMLGGIQPARINELVRAAVSGSNADDGFLQRFGMTVWPDLSAGYRYIDQRPDGLAKAKAYAVFDRLNALKPDMEPTVWRFTPEAQPLFVEWLTELEHSLRADTMHPALVSHHSKYRKLIPALALIFQLIDNPDSGELIGEESLIRALGWFDYLKTHAARLYHTAGNPSVADAGALLAKLKAGALSDAAGEILQSFTARQVSNKGWSGLQTSEGVRAAAEVLIEHGYLQSERVTSNAIGGRPTERYIVNPALLSGAV